MVLKEGKSESIEEFFSIPLEINEIALLYIGYSGIILRTPGSTIAFDIADLLGENEVKALKMLDLLLFTHSHRDHYDNKTALRVFEETNPHIVAESSVAGRLKGRITKKLTIAESGRTYKVGDFNVTAIEGIHRGPIILYLVETQGKKIFHGGDSGYISLKDFSANLALLPTGKPSPTASPENAYKMAKDLGPKVMVAIHGSDEQNREIEKILKERLPEITLVVPKEFKSEKITLD